MYRNRCQTRQRAVKQMSIRRLPPVLCFHAKRFEHHAAGGGRKLDTPLLFPLDDLDLRPFLSSAVLRSRYAMHACHGGSTTVTTNSCPPSTTSEKCAPVD